MSKKEVKTNAMRMLDRAKVSYTYEEYECDDFTDGIQTADKLGYDHKLVYKTLVTTGKTGKHREHGKLPTHTPAASLVFLSLARM